jgi:hypothetical protein
MIRKASESLPRTPGISRRGLLKAGLGVTGVGLVMPSTAAYAAAVAANDLIVTNYRLSPPGWRKGQRLTITAIADIHAGGPNMGLARVREVVDAAQRLKSDLIVVLGDYFATHRFVTERVPGPAWAAELARLSAPLGVHAILGNHDWWYSLSEVRQAFANIRVPLMENDAVLLGKEGERFWLAGLGDQLAHYIAPGHFEGVDDLPGTLTRITTDDPVILLAHFPRGAGTRVADARRSYPRRSDQAAADRAGLGAIDLRGPLCLRPHRRAQSAHDRVRRLGMLESAVTARRAA